MKTTTKGAGQGANAGRGRHHGCGRSRSVPWIAAVACWAGVATLSGCSGGGGSGSPGPGPGEPPLAEPQLAQFETCDELRAAIVADARQKIETQAEHPRQDGWVFADDRDVF